MCIESWKKEWKIMNDSHQAIWLFYAVIWLSSDIAIFFNVRFYTPILAVMVGIIGIMCYLNIIVGNQNRILYEIRRGRK